MHPIEREDMSTHKITSHTDNMTEKKKKNLSIMIIIIIFIDV